MWFRGVAAFIGLYLDLSPVLEGDGYLRVLGDGHMIDHRQPVLIPEDRQWLPLFQACQKQLDLLPAGFPVGDLLGQYLLAGFGGVEPSHQSVVALLVFILIEGDVGIFLDALLDQTGDHVDLCVQSIQLLLQGICCEIWLQHLVVDGDDPVLGVDHLIGGPEENLFQLILCERRRRAFLSLELVIALPDHSAVEALDRIMAREKFLKNPTQTQEQRVIRMAWAPYYRPIADVEEDCRIFENKRFNYYLTMTYMDMMFRRGLLNKEEYKLCHDKIGERYGFERDGLIWWSGSPEGEKKVTTPQNSNPLNAALARCLCVKKGSATQVIKCGRPFLHAPGIVMTSSA